MKDKHRPQRLHHSQFPEIRPDQVSSLRLWQSHISAAAFLNRQRHDTPVRLRRQHNTRVSRRDSLKYKLPLSGVDLKKYAVRIQCHFAAAAVNRSLKATAFRGAHTLRHNIHKWQAAPLGFVLVELCHGPVRDRVQQTMLSAPQADFRGLWQQ